MPEFGGVACPTVTAFAIFLLWKTKKKLNPAGTQILAIAREKEQVVRLHVEQFNPAQMLYKRLGFKVIEDTGVHFLMEWSGFNNTCSSIAKSKEEIR